MASQDNLAQDQADYRAAFDEPATARVEQTDDQAFGLDVDAAAAAEPDPVDPVDPAAGEGGAASAEDAAAAESAEGAADAGGAPADAAVDPAGDDEPTDPKEIQRQKSWEGRLKAEEKRLKALADELEAKGAAAGEAPGEAAADALDEVAETTANPELKEAAEAVSDQVEAGTMTAEQAMAQLSEDFGPDFVKMIEVIASAKAAEAGAKAAGEKVAEVGKSVEDVISHIQDEKARAHFERIAEAHPDFDELANSAPFKAYVNGLTEADKAEALRVVEGGSAKEIIKLLDTYKAGAAPAQEEAAPAPAVAAAPAAPSEEDEASLDDAEGVRSAGLSLPKQPGPAGSSYEEAWAES